MIYNNLKIVVTVTDDYDKKSLELNRKLTESLYEFRTRALRDIANILPDYKKERIREYHE